MTPSSARRSPGLVALTRRRLATPRSAALVIVALTLVASFLIAAAPRALSGVVRDEVAFQLDQLSVPARDVTTAVRNAPGSFGATTGGALTAGWAGGAAEVFGGLAARLTEIRSSGNSAVRAATGDAAFIATAGAIEVAPEVLPPTAPTGLVELIADPLYQQHLALVDGEWPSPYADTTAPIEIVLTAAAAARIEWPLGQLRAAPVGDVLLVGLVEPVDADADRWAHHPPTVMTGTFFDDGNRRPSATGGAYVDPGSWPAISGSGDLTIWYEVDAAAASRQDPDQLLSGLRQLTAQSFSLDEYDTRAKFASDAVSVLGTALARSHASSATLAVAAVGPIAVSVALIVLAASLIIRRRRGDLLLLSARGTALVRLRGLLLLEGLILGVPVAVAATAAALVLVPDDAGPMPTAFALAIGFVPAAALALALRPQTLAGGRTDLDAPVRGRWARLAELLILLLAGVAVTMLVVRGVGSASAGIDPLVVVAPMLATVALGLLAVRLHPLWLSAALRTAQRGRGVVGLVGAARSLRDPAAGTTAVLAMLVAVAIAVFSSLVLATVDRGAVTAAERTVGAELSLSGPFFDGETIEAMREVDGVAALTGVMAADRVSVVGEQGRVVASLLVTETDQLGRVQAGFAEGFDPSALRAGHTPPETLVSAAVAEDVGLGVTTEPYGGVAVVGVAPAVPGTAAGSTFLIMDRQDYTAATGREFFPRTLLVAVADGADVHEVRRALNALVDAPHTTQTLADRTAAIQSSPAVSALRIALMAALVLAVALSVVAVLLVAGVTRDARSRVIALLRTMGLGRRDARGVVAWEFVPLGLSALVGGLVLGALLPLLVLVSVDLRPFTGGIRQPGLTVDPVLTAGLIVAVVLALAVSVVGGVLTARTTSLVTVLRTEEDR